MNVSALDIGYKKLNEIIKNTDDDITINDCFGERFIGCAQSKKFITINGTPGNALGAYLNGADIVVNGNVQDAVGDTMNEGKIIVNGNAGDALGYAMRGGEIFIKGDTGYRTGIHMKEYNDKKPVIVIGGGTGSFLGEYLAGGIIIVLGLNYDNIPVGNFVGTGMHGGKIFIRSKKVIENISPQINVKQADKNDLESIKGFLKDFADIFNENLNEIFNVPFYKLTANEKNPYKQLYALN